MKITNPFAPSTGGNSVVKPLYLSHGTMECYRLQDSRRFYEQFLGLECVRHAKPSMAVRCGLKFHIIALEVGDLLHPAAIDNHWGIDVGSAEEVERIWHAAHQLAPDYGIRTISELVKQHGVYSFYIEDLDHNWWEIQYYYDGIQHEDMFDFGDRYEESELHDQRP